MHVYRSTRMTGGPSLDERPELVTSPVSHRFRSILLLGPGDAQRGSDETFYIAICHFKPEHFLRRVYKLRLCPRHRLYFEVPDPD